MPKIDLEQAYNDLKQKYDKHIDSMSAAEAKARTDINAKDKEIKRREDRISELQTEISGLKVELSKKDGDRAVLSEKITQLQSLIERLDGDKVRLEKEKEDLSALSATFKTEQDRAAEQIQNLHAHLDRMEDQLKVFGEKDKDKTDSIQDAQGKERENILKAKITAETKAQNLEKEIQELRRKMRESGDGLLGSSMEIESLKDKLKQREQEIQKIQDRMFSLTTGNTGVIMEVADVVKIMKEKLARGKRNVRVVVPNLKDFERHGFIPLLEKMPPQAVVYVAAAIDSAGEEELVNNLRDKKVQLVNFQERNMYGLNVDGATCLLALVSPDNPDNILAGFYTDIEAAVPVFKDAIQKAWVKGTKW
jgi:predicted  nucleic acid-binding Zn-ribbon protein